MTTLHHPEGWRKAAGDAKAEFLLHLSLVNPHPPLPLLHSSLSIQYIMILSNRFNVQMLPCSIPASTLTLMWIMMQGRLCFTFTAQLSTRELLTNQVRMGWLQIHWTVCYLSDSSTYTSPAAGQQLYNYFSWNMQWKGQTFTNWSNAHQINKDLPK